MATNLQGRLLKGFAAQGYAQAGNLLIQILSVPLYIHYWGRVMYGEWILLSSVLGYLAMSDLSFGNAAQNEMAMRVARGDRGGALTVFQSAWLLVTLVSLGFMVAAISVVSVIPIEIWLKLRMSHGVAVSIVYVLILQVILGQQGGFLTAGFRCEGNYALGGICDTTLRLLEFSAAAIILICGGGLWAVASAVLVMRIMGYTVNYLIMRRCSPWLSIGRKYAQFQVIKPLIVPALSFNAFPLGYAFSLQGVVTVIGVNLGPAAVTTFSISRTLTRLVWQILNGVGNTVWVELSAAFGAHNLALARRLHRRACQLAFWGALLATCFLAIGGRMLFRVWTHGRVPFDGGLFHLLLLVVVCSSLWVTSYVVPLAINKHGPLAIVFLAATSLSMGLAALFVRFWGLNGAAIALLISEVIMIVYVVRGSLRLLDDHFDSYIRIVLTPPIRWLWARFVVARAGAH